MGEAGPRETAPWPLHEAMAWIPQVDETLRHGHGDLQGRGRYGECLLARRGAARSRDAER